MECLCDMHGLNVCACHSLGRRESKHLQQHPSQWLASETNSPISNPPPPMSIIILWGRAAEGYGARQEEQPISPGGCGSAMAQGLPVTNEMSRDLNPGFLPRSLSHMSIPGDQVGQTGLKALRGSL